MKTTTWVERYGTETWEDPEMDAMRRSNCLCLRCAKLKRNQRDNCVMAQVMYALCVTKGMAMGISRCVEFQGDNESA